MKELEIKDKIIKLESKLHKLTRIKNTLYIPEKNIIGLTSEELEDLNNRIDIIRTKIKILKLTIV